MGTEHGGDRPAALRIGTTAVLLVGLAWLGWPAAASAQGVIAGGGAGLTAPLDGVPPLATEPFAGPALGDEACMQALRQCCCCPGWDHYAIFDVLFLQRNNQAGNQPLMINTQNGAPVMNVQDLQPSMATGVRVFYGRLLTDTVGWEVGYTGIYGMFGEATAADPDGIDFPDPLGTEFTDASSARATYWSTLNIAEANLFWYDCCQECGPRCRPSCHCVSFLTGFIWAGLDEQSSIDTLCCDPPEDNRYGTVRASTNYFGPQIGMWGRREWCRWAVEGWWKTAVCGTTAYQAQDPLVSSVTGLVRPGRSSTDTGVGFIGGLNGTLVYRITDVWGLRAGYNMYWLTNAALAPTQYDFGAFVDSGARINDNGGIFLHGANLGVEARW